MGSFLDKQGPNMPPWRNWIAHRTSNPGVAGSSPVGGNGLPYSLVVRIFGFHPNGRGSNPRRGRRSLLWPSHSFGYQENKILIQR